MNSNGGGFWKLVILLVIILALLFSVRTELARERVKLAHKKRKLQKLLRKLHQVHTKGIGVYHLLLFLIPLLAIGAYVFLAVQLALYFNPSQVVSATCLWMVLVDLTVLGLSLPFTEGPFELYVFLRGLPKWLRKSIYGKNRIDIESKIQAVESKIKWVEWDIERLPAR